MISDRRLFLNADKSAVVEESDASAATLFAPAGHAIEPADAERYGLTLVDDVVVLPVADQGDQDTGQQVGDDEKPAGRKKK